MAIKYTNSLFSKDAFKNLGKVKIPTLPKFLTHEFDAPVIPIINNPNLTQKEILNFLKENSVSQSKTALNQFRTIRLLTIISVLFACISTFFIARDYIYPKNNNDISIQLLQMLEERQSNTKIISELSVRLFDLQNQVKALEKENEVIRKE